jgi:acetyl esterase/lipase
VNSQKSRVRRRIALAVLALLLITVAILFRATRDQQRAAALLIQIEGTEPPAVLSFNACKVEELPATLPGGIQGRLYRPREHSHAPGLVVLHGVHRLGIEEPRLRNFARAFAETCVQVLTPQLASLADYRVEPKAIEEIGAATVWFSNQLHRPVGVLGLSFAGGLALVAATDPRYSRDTAFVVAVGAHSDLARVSRFLISGQTELPDGRTQKLEPEQYGGLVLAFAHPDEFFPKKEALKAQHCMRLWLGEEYESARACKRTLSPRSEDMLEALFQYRIEHLRARLLAEIEQQKQTMASVSPSGRLAKIKVPVFLLHGEQDGVIPPSETKWLAHEIPPRYLRKVLISPAVVHVDPQQTSWQDKWQLVSFLASVLRESERSTSSSPAQLESQTSSP